MIHPLFILFSGLAVITLALSSGLFLTFSDFMMRALKLSRADAGIEVMQIVNREIWNSLTMVLLLGNLPLSLGLAGYAYAVLPAGPAQWLIMASAALYLTGMFGLTFLFNVPMNRQLDRWDFASADASRYWQTYVPRWTFWNYGRAIATAASSACLLIALTLIT